MTSELGIGANIAIESAITLANILHRQVTTRPNSRLIQTELSALFTEYQDARFDRTKGYVKLSGQVTRMYSYRTVLSRLWVSYVSPWMRKTQVMQLAESISRAPKLDYVSVTTMNEEARGWRLAKAGGNTGQSGLWFFAALSTVIAMVGVYVASASRSALA